MQIEDNSIIVLETRDAVASTQEKSQVEEIIHLDEKIDFGSLLEAWSKKDTDLMNIVFNELQTRESNINEKLKNEAFYYSLLFRLGEDSVENFRIIEDKARDTDVYSNVLNVLALAYEHTENFMLAKSYYEKALLDPSSTIRVNLTIGISECLFSMGQKEDAISYLIKAISDSENNEYRFRYYKQIADLSNKNSNSIVQSLALEKALEIKPNDTEILFSLAYTYSNVDMHLLSLLHYKAVLRFDKTNENALNNLGVSLSNLGLEIQSISNYKDAIKLGNTLAAVNLAYKYMNNGFAEEAEKTLEQVKDVKNAHQNVYSALSQLKETINESVNNEKEKISEATLLREFQKITAESRLSVYKIVPSKIEGEWLLNNLFNSTIEIDLDQINITWERYSTKYKYSGKIMSRFVELQFYEMTYDYKIPRNEKKYEEKEKHMEYISYDDERVQIYNFKDKVIYSYSKIIVD